MEKAIEIPETKLVLAEEFGDKGIITLNRPKALNALNYEMARKIAACIETWQYTKSMIIIKGNGGKAFCAGGDVKSYVTAKDPYEAGRLMCRTMLPVNYIIGNLKIPYVAFIDGFVIGGAGGISVHGKYRIATEKTVFAMPEVALGNFEEGCKVRKKSSSFLNAFQEIPQIPELHTSCRDSKGNLVFI